MRQLLPWPADVDEVEVDPEVAYLVDRPRPTDRPWTVSMMVSTADGAAALAGRTRSLGGEGDHRVFHAGRALADAIIVGAGTIRDENYGPVRVPDHVMEARVSRGQAPHPRLVVVSSRLNLDPDGKLFRPADAAIPRPLVVHPSSAPADARRALERVAELREVPPSDTGGVAAADLLAALDTAGVDVAVVEGGPTLNGSFVAADLLDEMCLTIDPMIVGGAAPRIVQQVGPTVARAWRPAHLFEQDGVLFWRLLRDRDADVIDPS